MVGRQAHRPQPPELHPPCPSQFSRLPFDDKLNEQIFSLDGEYFLLVCDLIFDVNLSLFSVFGSLRWEPGSRRCHENDEETIELMQKIRHLQVEPLSVFEMRYIGQPFV